MKYYVFIQDGRVKGKGCCPVSSEKMFSVEVDESVYEEADKYIYSEGELIENPDYETEQAEIEAKRIANLMVSATDVERAIYKTKGYDFNDIVELVEASNEAGTTDIDIKALKIELKADNFYRGNDYVVAVGALLGFTETQLNNFFETNDYTALTKE